MEVLFNPFIDVGYRGPQYFCDREGETELLINYIRNKTNTTLFAFRRLGKTGLIKHVFHKLKKEKNIACIYVDIQGTNNKNDFINQLATSIYNTFPEKTNIGATIIKAIKSLSPTIQFDALTGQPSVSIITSHIAEQQNTISSLLQFIDKQNIQVVFAIDEFQQILSYPEKNIEAILRTEMQQLTNTSFIFCGSNQNMMHEIFNSAKRPFFASCTYLHLDYINDKKYAHFIKRTYDKHNKTISNEAVEFICTWTMRHTFYTQYLCNAIFSKYNTDINLTKVKETASDIISIQEGKFYQYRNLLTASQWKLLKAIAKEERLTKPHSKELILKYAIGTSSMVSRGIDSLLKKEMILHNTGVETPYYEVYDKFLMRWLQNKY